MITVEYLGKTGNNAFQYCYGRLLAHYLKQSFRAAPIEMFPELPTGLGPDHHSIGKMTIFQTSRHNEVLTFPRIARMAEGFDLVLKCHFEVGTFYHPYAAVIRQWFNPAGDLIDGTAIHVRGSDGEHNSPPMEYYAKAITNDPFGVSNCTVFTDDVNCAIAKELAALGYPVLSDTPANDFAAIRRHKRIIIGNSTFAWWAAFLSNATTVIQPEPLHGFRSAEVPNSYLKVPAWQQVQY